MDFVIDVEKMPKPGETVLGKKFTLVPGGKGANQAYAIGKLGADVKMIGAIGEDENGIKLIDNLNSVNVLTSGITRMQNENTGCAFINVDETGENSIVVIGGANQKVTKRMIDNNIDLINEAVVIVMQLEIPIDVVTYVAKIAKEKGKYVILDPAPARGDLPDELFENVDIIKPNETEIQILSGKKAETEEELKEAAQVLIQKGVKKVIITLGGKGSMLVSKQGYIKFEAKEVKVVDTTAAGDSFTAALTKALVEKKSLEEAIEFAHIVSSIVVTKKGAQTSIPNMDEVREFIRRNK